MAAQVGTLFPLFIILPFHPLLSLSLSLPLLFPACFTGCDSVAIERKRCSVHLFHHRSESSRNRGTRRRERNTKELGAGLSIDPGRFVSRNWLAPWRERPRDIYIYIYIYVEREREREREGREHEARDREEEGQRNFHFALLKGCTTGWTRWIFCFPSNFLSGKRLFIFVLWNTDCHSSVSCADSVIGY